MLDLLKKILQTLGNNGTCIGKQTLTVNGTVSQLTVPADTAYGLIVLESNAANPGAAIRYWEDGTAPTTTDGIPRTDGSAWDVSSAENLRKIKFIQAQAGTHTIFVEYFKS